MPAAAPTATSAATATARSAAPQSGSADPRRSPPAPPAPPALDPERLALERALAEAGGVVARAAARLGLSRQALYRRLEKHGLALRRRLEDE
jgi:transcriptional regulator of acetoin/glycerol metabolism